MPIVPPSSVFPAANFDPSRFADVQRMTRETGEYLIPAIRQLSGMTGYFAAPSPTGSIVHVSLWGNEAKAQQMTSLKEMIVNARQAAEDASVTFIPVVNYPIAWKV